MKVSIAIVTYNHEAFIAKALDSVLMQRTNFEYEIVIGEDCSNDNTRDIVSAYKRRYPDIIQLFLNEKNLGMHENGAQVLEACKGEYIAMLDGDDYWTSPDKLQKQADFLDNHPECTVCFHDALIVHEDKSEEPTRYRTKQKEFSTVEDLLIDNFIPTAAVMYRRGLIGRVSWAEALKMGDWVIHILNALHGKIGYIDEIMSVYVVHRGGVWSTKDSKSMLLSIVDLFEALDKHLGARYTRIIDRILRWRYLILSEVYENSSDLVTAKTYAIKSITRHLSIIMEPVRFINNIDTNPDVLLPNYIKTINTECLFKTFLRLYLVPIFKLYIPSIYKSFRAIVLKLGLMH